MFVQVEELLEEVAVMLCCIRVLSVRRALKRQWGSAPSYPLAEGTPVFS